MRTTAFRRKECYHPAIYVIIEKRQLFTLEAVSAASMGKAAKGGSRGSHIIMRRLGEITHPKNLSAKELRRVHMSSSTA